MASQGFNPAGTGPGTPATTTAPPASTGAPAASPTVPAAGAAPTVTVPPSTTAAPSTAPVPGAPPASPTVPAPTGPNADNIAVLRQSHETLQSLGDLNQVREGLGVFQAIYTEAKALGTKLSYTNESLQEAFKADPVGTINLLRKEAQEADANRDPNEDKFRDIVRRETAPLMDHLARQMADKHNASIDGEFTRLFSVNEAFKPRNGAECPPEIRGIVRDRFIETIKWNDGILKEVAQGKLSGLTKVFDEIVADTLAGWNKYQSWGTTQAPGTGQRGSDGRFAAAPTTTTPGTRKELPADFLNKVIEGDPSVDEHLPSMRGFR